MAATKTPKPTLDLDGLESMLTRLKLTAIRDQLDTLLDQATRQELNLREALTLLCTAEVGRKDERRIQMGLLIAKFPFVRTLEAFEFDAQPSDLADHVHVITPVVPAAQEDSRVGRTSGSVFGWHNHHYWIRSL